MNIYIRGTKASSLLCARIFGLLRENQVNLPQLLMESAEVGGGSGTIEALPGAFFEVFFPCCTAQYHTNKCYCRHDYTQSTGLYHIELGGCSISADKSNWINMAGASLTEVPTTLLCTNPTTCNCIQHRHNSGMQAEAGPASISIDRSSGDGSVTVANGSGETSASSFANTTPELTPQDITQDGTAQMQSSFTVHEYRAEPAEDETNSSASGHEPLMTVLTAITDRLENFRRCQEELVRIQDRQGQIIAKMLPLVYQRELWDRVNMFQSTLDEIQQYLVGCGSGFQYGNETLQ
jgi:hypothetical protein